MRLFKIKFLFIFFDKITDFYLNIIKIDCILIILITILIKNYNYFLMKLIFYYTLSYSKILFF